MGMMTESVVTWGKFQQWCKIHYNDGDVGVSINGNIWKDK